MAAKLLVTRVRRRQKRMSTFVVGWSLGQASRVVRNEQRRAARVIHHLVLGM
jgi:hypothetical protein